MFVDKVKISIKAGDGGDGVVSFFRLKTVLGGPDGGSGGSGGSIIFKADSSLNNLSDFYYKTKFKAKDGQRGQTKNCFGKTGEDLIIPVPKGTIIKDYETQSIIADMFYDGQTKLVLKGGRGGKGNASFCTATRRSPAFCQKGEKSETKEIFLELKTIADVGLCGFPNVGKSTLLSQISNAKPKIANYHFTTLSPSLGIVRYFDSSFVAADIPGLIEGAAEGKGLGHDFLRHIERVRLIIHVIDMSGSEQRDPYDDYKKINFELKSYSKKLTSCPQIIAANKMDLPISKVNLEKFASKVKDTQIIPVSAVTKEGLETLIKKTFEKLQTLPKLEPVEYIPFEYVKKDTTEFIIEKTADNVYLLSGGLVDNLCRNVSLDDYDSFNYFQKKLKEFGVIEELKLKGCKNGDTVIFSDFDFEFLE